MAASLAAASLSEQPLSSLGWSLLMSTSSSGGSQPPFVTSQPLTASKASSQCAPLTRTRSQVPPASLQESRAASQQPRPVPLPAAFPGPWLSTRLGSAVHNCSRPSRRSLRCLLRAHQLYLRPWNRWSQPSTMRVVHPSSPPHLRQQGAHAMA